ncbi:cysteine-rich motor neuron 1 protein-like [Thrips palmi]|uniref:Cysteine-rich motor neuron 1 protein-like n=1 Tax=Thrips palmi TaxID=161013 RepID=A0A6P8YY97_THRPL|nr:cysteine-rich motor neuron 1 protein-like [Thrips palmi]
MCQVSCDNPRRVQGECCPACDGLSVVTQSQSCPSLGNCTLKCTHGFVLDDVGCYTCQCQQGAACTLECHAGYARDAAGNELCECACPAMENCSKRCAHGYRKDASGCSQCACLPGAETSQPVVGEGAPPKSCADAVRERDDGEYWWDGCRGCYCWGGATLCELASCKDVPSALRRMADHALCDSASAASAAAPREPPSPLLRGSGCAGHHAHGTSWRESDCRSCRCVHGSTECFEQRCAALHCDLQFTPRGMCCPACLGDGSKLPPKLAPQGTLPSLPLDGGLGGLGGLGGRAGRPTGTCWWRGQALAPADEWFPDECTHCQCDPAGSGSSTCTQVVCPAGPACSSAASRASSRAPFCCPPCQDGAGGVTLLVSLLVVVALLVLVVLALGYFVWQRNRRQTLHIARADAVRPNCQARPAATYTYNMIPPLSRSA